MRRHTLALVILLMLATLVAACAPAPEPTASEAAPTEAAAEEAPAEAPAEEAAAEEAPAEEAAAAGTVIKIATQSPLSGPQSVLGTAIKNGAQLSLEQNSARLQEMGFTVELAPYDDQATPDTGVANATQIAADPAVLCMVGHLNSGVMIPSMEVYHNAQLAAVSPANTNPTVTERGYVEVNRIVGRDDVQGVVGENFAREEMGVQSVYIVHDKTSYGQGVAEFFRQSAEANGMAVLGFEGTEEQANFDSILTPILAANPDLIYFGGIYSQGGILFKQARDKGITAQFMGPDGLDASELASLGGEAVAGMYYSSVAGPANVYPATQQFIADYEARFGEQTQPFAAQGYDAMGICLQGIEKAIEANDGQLPERAQVAEAVRATAGYSGITGEVTFNDKGDKTVATYFVLQVASADPALWNTNQVVKLLDIPAP
ncbi:MAG: branched-chain amino acid ABC transporter substrate-binding protein [Caldilinea sp.]|jgi:branched-chain amino acid transport system substrate-binding protein|nr:branched-chain amino acid ABC transporter substrate-binding protein [Caldilinea sp.]